MGLLYMCRQVSQSRGILCTRMQVFTTQFILALLVQILTHNFTMKKVQILTRKNAVERFIGQHTVDLLVPKYLLY